ncbi:SET domain-containing protein-lysine N-methyltransferase [Chitinophaga alhagiae]|uniref:SET domain-containing protein-lysine N-methyltransferase n=1 Tax=Chitinophaga alhagiae TaxID=2203219 RepID=A0ABM6W924_9BACT|nr:SET domain-containing protein [Chitinophaga alhagiae]AWO00416.1 SET domain-containing protein-lysine N-methyltransferase [Chitinophaga alhagiae]
MIKPYLYIQKTKEKGRGVFTKEPIPAGTQIEISPVLVLSNNDTQIVDKTKLHNYIFLWGARETRSCIALGFCSIYNHAYDPNCEYEMDFEAETMAIKTRRDIRKGEELSINYNGEVEDSSPVWFDVKRK